MIFVFVIHDTNNYTTNMHFENNLNKKKQSTFKKHFYHYKMSCTILNHNYENIYEELIVHNRLNKRLRNTVSFLPLKQ